MIRIILGLMVVLGAVGTLEIDANSSVLLQSGIAAVGLLLMYSGTRKIQE